MIKHSGFSGRYSRIWNLCASASSEQSVFFHRRHTFITLKILNPPAPMCSMATTQKWMKPTAINHKMHHTKIILISALPQPPGTLIPTKPQTSTPQNAPQRSQYQSHPPHYPHSHHKPDMADVWSLRNADLHFNQIPRYHISKNTLIRSISEGSVIW